MKENIWKSNLLKYFLLIGFVTLSIFSIQYYISGNIILSEIEFTFGLVFVISIFLIKKGLYELPGTIAWLGVFFVLSTLLFTGGIAGTGMLWWTLIPVVSFIVFGLTGGTFASLVAVVFLILVGFLQYFDVINTYYSIVQVRQTGAIVIVLSIIMYFFEKIAGLVREDALTKSKLLSNIQIELQKNIESLSKDKIEQDKIRMAILNILEDSKELENRLNEEKERASTIINSMGEGLFVLDSNHQIELINPAAQKMLELSDAEVYGKNWSDIVSSYVNDRKIPITERSTIRSLKNQKIITTNLEDNHYYITKKGKRFPIISTTTPMLKDGKVIGVIKVFRDVTSDKNSKEIIEETVVEKTAELSASITNLPIGFMLVDVNGVVKLTNSKLDVILGFKAKGKNINDLGITISNGNETQYKNKYLRVFKSPVKTQNEENFGTIILLEDITEAKIIDRSRDEFFSIASHELRTPLTAIRGNTELIREHYTDKIKDPEMNEMINDIHESSVKLIGIVNDFLNVSRLEMGRMEFKKERVDLYKLIKEIVHELMVTAKKSNLYLNIDKGISKMPLVYADPDRTAQVLINLIGNGLKFTEKGGVVLSCQKESKYVKVIISDTGRGLSKSGQNLLFHKFQQAGDSLTTRDTTKGTGLGLYISKRIIEGMGGTIWLEKSVVNQGSVFCFTLPVV